MNGNVYDHSGVRIGTATPAGPRSTTAGSGSAP